MVEIVSDHSVRKDTRRLPAFYYRAGIQEYWLMDARGDQLLFQIQCRGNDAYEPALMDAQGFQVSPVLNRRFRLARRRGRLGGWDFDLEHAPADAS